MTRIRPYRAEDRAACQRMVFDAVQIGAAEFYTAAQRDAWAPTPTPDDATPDRFLTQIALVAEDGDGITGFMTLAPGDGYLDMAYVAPRAMGTGVAAHLLTRIIEAARTHGLARLSTHASHLARRFLLKHGWRVDAAEIAQRRGQIIERFRMSVDLERVS